MLKSVPFALMLPTLALASPVWKGDFETGNLSQWDREQSVSASRLQVVSAPVREGRYALKVTVQQGDAPTDASGNRNEVLHMGLEAPGTESFYKWSTLFPSSFPRAPTRALFTQWHHEGNGGSSPLELYVVDDELTLRVGGDNGKIVWSAPLQREHWNDFILHVKWSSDPNVGFLELYHDGKLVLPRMNVATQYPGQRNYLELGLHRDASIPPEGVVFHDGFVQATRLEDVMPASATPSEAPSSAQQGLVAQEPSDSSASTPGMEGIILGDSTLAAGVPPANCGASATGGTPLLVAAALTLAALLGRRKPTPASASARRTYSRRR